VIGPSTAPTGAPRGQKMGACVHSGHCVEERRSWVGAGVSCELSLHELPRCLSVPGRTSYKAGRVNGRDQRGTRTAASAAYLNHPVERTGHSARRGARPHGNGE
jgi:hypothetical protein